MFITYRQLLDVLPQIREEQLDLTVRFTHDEDSYVIDIHTRQLVRLPRSEDCDDFEGDVT